MYFLFFFLYYFYLLNTLSFLKTNSCPLPCQSLCCLSLSFFPSKMGEIVLKICSVLQAGTPTPPLRSPTNYYAQLRLGHEISVDLWKCREKNNNKGKPRIIQSIWNSRSIRSCAYSHERAFLLQVVPLFLMLVKGIGLTALGNEVLFLLTGQASQHMLPGQPASIQIWEEGKNSLRVTRSSVSKAYIVLGLSSEFASY